MILVTVGTNEARFDRLLDAVATLPRGERLLVQHGHSKRVEHPDAELVSFLGYDQLAAAMGEARVVVTHAGVGSVLTALAAGKRPVVVPRLRRHGEAVDDHQLQLARRLGEVGLARVAEPAGLAAAVAQGGGSAPEPLRSTPLGAELRGYLGGLVGAPS